MDNETKGISVLTCYGKKLIGEPNVRRLTQCVLGTIAHNISQMKCTHLVKIARRRATADFGNLLDQFWSDFGTD